MNEPNEIDSLRTRAEKAEAACAELKGLIMREVRIPYNCHCPQCKETRNKVEHALSTDCGKGWISPQEAERLKEERNRIGMEVRREFLPKLSKAQENRKAMLERIEKLRSALNDIANCDVRGMTDSNFTDISSMVALMQRTAKQALEETK